MKNRRSDNVEEEIFEFTKNDINVPVYVNKAINDAMCKINSTPKSIFHNLKRIAIIILSLAIMSTGVVFAKDIVNFFKHIFINSTPGIKSAIENGDVQDVETGFVYDNDVGIKIDSLVVDNNIMDISFQVKLNKFENEISNIAINELKMLDEDDYITIHNSENEKEFYDNDYISYFETTMDTIRDSKGVYHDSILLRFSKKSNLEFLRLDILKLDIYTKEEKETVIGNWQFNIDLSNKMVSKKQINYEMNYDSNILIASNNVNKTNFVIDINFIKPFDKMIISDYNSLILTDNKNHIYNISEIITEGNNVHIVFDYGKYILEDYLNLYIKYDEDKDTNIEFIKGA